MADPTFRAVSSPVYVPSSGNGSANLALPAGTVDGEYVFIEITTDAGSVVANVAPAGFTPIQVIPNNASRSGLKVYGKVASSEPAFYTLTESASSGNAMAVAISYSNPGGTPINASAQSAEQVGTATVALPALTTTATGKLIGFIAECNGRAPTYTSSGALTERLDTSSPRNAGIVEVDVGTTGSVAGYAVAGSVTGDYYAVSVLLAGPATAPILTGPSGAAGASSININVAENSTALGTWTATNGATWSISGGADAAQVQISAGGVVTFLAPNDFENPDDVGANRVYNFTVQNVGAGGTSTQDVVATLTNVTELPGAPTIGTATAGNATVTVPFTPPSAGTAPSVIDFTVTLSPGGATKIVSASPAVFTSADGVVNGTAYTGAVTARNSDGTGSASAASNSVTPAAVAYTCSILDWVLPTASQHALGEQWNISFHNPSTRALVANFPAAALVAGVNGAGQACRNLVASSTSFVPGTTYAWFATHPTNPAWFAVGLATAA